MSKRAKYLWVAAAWGGLCVGGWAFAQDATEARRADDAAQPAAPSSDKSAKRADGIPEGSGRAVDRDMKEVHATLARAAEATLSEDGLTKLSEVLAQPDRKRLDVQQEQDPADSSAKADDTADFRKRVSQFRQDWKARYGGDFDIQNESVVFSGVRPGAGAGTTARAGDDDKDPDKNAQTAGAKDEAANTPRKDPDRPAADKGAERVTDSGGVQVGDEAKAGEIPSDGSKASDKQRPGDRPAGSDTASAASDGGDVGNGRTMTVVVPPQRGAEGPQVRLVREEGGWRIDLPDTMTRRQLAESLAQRLEAVQRQKDTWPDNAADAQRLVSGEMLMALTETGKETEGGARPIQR